MSKQVNTHKLSELKKLPGSPLTLPVRNPGWHPDAIDVADPNKPGSSRRVNVLPEEAVGFEKVPGSNNDKILSFDAQFAEGTNNSKWILGSSLHPSSASALPFTRLLNDLATLARRYNASLYTLRRLKFHFDKFGGPHQFPPRNPHSRDRDLTGVSENALKPLIADAEIDFAAKGDAINDFLDAKAPGFTDPNKYAGFVFHGADMVEVNNYIVSMRVVVFKPAGELVGSSSHVSISSAFSSSSP